jgi:hypothetical protein
MFDEDSKDNRNKAKEALLEWVRKKLAGYVNYHFHLIFFFVNTSLDLIHHLNFFGEIIY